MMQVVIDVTEADWRFDVCLNHVEPLAKHLIVTKSDECEGFAVTCIYCDD